MAIITVLKEDWECPYPWQHKALRPQVIEEKMHLNETAITGVERSSVAYHRSFCYSNLQPLLQSPT